MDDLLRKIGILVVENDWLRAQLQRLTAERDALVVDRDRILQAAVDPEPPNDR